MAIYHVLVVFPEKNDLVDYSQIENSKARSLTSRPQKYDPTTSLEKISHSHEPVQSVLKLDWNEGVIPPPPSVSQALISFIQAAEGTFLKWYPHLAGGEELRGKLAEYCDVIPENILVTNGSDDALILICHSYLTNGVNVVAPVPTYEHFCVNAIGAGGHLIRMDQANPFHNDLQEIETAVETHHPRLVYLVSPNNPTGTQWTPEQILSLCTRYPGTNFIVDEAYIEFGTVDPATDTVINCAQLATQHPNVIVTRTFSKAFCLASVRCGYIIAHPNTIEFMRAYYNPKSVNQFAQVAAYHALLEFNSYYKPYIRSVNMAREAFIQQLHERNVHVQSGGAGNFVCLSLPPQKITPFCRALEEKSIYIRDIGGRFPGYVRITIGLDMGRVVDAIVDALAQI